MEKTNRKFNALSLTSIKYSMKQPVQENLSVYNISRDIKDAKHQPLS